MLPIVRCWVVGESMAASIVLLVQSFWPNAERCTDAKLVMRKSQKDIDCPANTSYMQWDQSGMADIVGKNKR